MCRLIWSGRPARRESDVRQVFPEIVEQARELSGHYGTKPGERGGCFVIRHPKSGQVFSVLVASAELWKAEGMKGEAWDHVSIACYSQKRTPTWDEMCW